MKKYEYYSHYRINIHAPCRRSGPSPLRESYRAGDAALFAHKVSIIMQDTPLERGILQSLVVFVILLKVRKYQIVFLFDEPAIRAGR
jgi:hypothetical protein